LVEYAAALKIAVDTDLLPSSASYVDAIALRSFPAIPQPSVGANGRWTVDGIEKSIVFYADFGTSSPFSMMCTRIILHSTYRRFYCPPGEFGISKNFFKSAAKSQEYFRGKLKLALQRRVMHNSADVVDGYVIRDDHQIDGRPLEKFEKRWLHRVARRGHSSGHVMPRYFPRTGRFDTIVAPPSQVYRSSDDYPPFVPDPGVHPPAPPPKQPFSPDTDRYFRVRTDVLPDFLWKQYEALGPRPKDHILMANGAAVYCITFKDLGRRKDIQQKAAVFYGKTNYITKGPGHTRLSTLMAESLCT
jgi:hypothetical protein